MGKNTGQPRTVPVTPARLFGKENSPDAFIIRLSLFCDRHLWVVTTTMLAAVSGALITWLMLVD